MQSDWSGDAAPGVSYVVPILNEEASLETTVGSILGQDYPGDVEIALVHGPSTDRTGDVIARLVEAHPDLIVVDNPAAKTPIAMNLGIAATTLPIVIRVDAHAALPPGYTATMVRALIEHGAVNVGGRMRARGEVPLQQAIAWAYNSPVGLGGGSHHVGGEERRADTAYLGVFRRDALEAAGGFDEDLARAQDWELNHRLRRAGGEIWFIPGVEVDYWPRATLSDLRRQFWSSGRWRGHLFAVDSSSVSFRHLIPPVFVVALLLSLVAAVAGALVGSLPVVLMGLALPALYAVIVAAVALTARGVGPRTRAWLFVVLPMVHITWGSGFLAGRR